MEITYNNVPERLIKKDVFKYIHVFTDNLDQTLNITESYNDTVLEGQEIIKNWISQGIKNIRMYYIHEETDHRDDLIYQIEETCIYSLGNYPN